MSCDDWSMHYVYARGYGSDYDDIIHVMVNTWVVLLATYSPTISKCRSKLANSMVPTKMSILACFKDFYAWLPCLVHFCANTTFVHFL